MKNILRRFFLLLLLANLMGKDLDEKELIFVYDVKSSLFNELIDFANKIISPKTYQCNLFSITYGIFKMEKRWSRYIQSLPLKSIFTYKNEISKNNLPNVNLPSILLREHNDLIELLTAREINDLNNFDQLIRVLDKRLEEYGMKTEKPKRVNFSDEEWQKKLTPEEYHILREKGTERPFTGEYDKFYEEGIYKCAGCDMELFTSDTKYNSGCGWPAFYESMPGKIEETEDNSFGMTRIEITCENCGGHLGHVFNDGPKPTGIRYCVNSASLDFKPEDKK